MPLSNNASNEEWTAAISDKISSVLHQVDSPSVAIVAAQSFESFIDHTLLKPDATPADIDKLCDEAIKFKFKSCCVNGAHIPQVTARLAGSGVIPCAVIGFPLGASKTQVKAFETKQAIADGALEVDMVVNIGALRYKNYSLVFSDIAACVQSNVTLKVILETVFLTEEEIIAASFIAAEAGAEFVKTCTGFLGGGASARHVQLMKTTVKYKEGVKVKASAGIRTLEKTKEMIAAGADRIGTSSGVAIMEGLQSAGNGY